MCAVALGEMCALRLQATITFADGEDTLGLHADRCVHVNVLATTVSSSHDHTALASQTLKQERLVPVFS